MHFLVYFKFSHFLLKKIVRKIPNNRRVPFAYILCSCYIIR